jgi:hypothetical protein
MIQVATWAEVFFRPIFASPIESFSQMVAICGLLDEFFRRASLQAIVGV